LGFLRNDLGSQNARRITTNFQIVPINGEISKNFSLRMGYGNFMIDDKALGEMNEFNLVEQNDCDKVTMIVNGHQQDYKITANGKDSMSLSSPWDETIVYQWTSPTSLAITSSFISGDYLCEDNNKVRVSVTKNFFWDNETLQKTTIPSSLINPSYINLLSEATGYPKENLILDPSTQPGMPAISPTAPSLPPAHIPEPAPTPGPPPSPAPPPPEASPDPAPGTDSVVRIGLVDLDAGLDSEFYISRLKDMMTQPLRQDALTCH
jgi:hypothetical protein